MRFVASWRGRCGSQSAIETLCYLSHKPRGFVYRYLTILHLGKDEEVKQIANKDVKQVTAERKLRVEANGTKAEAAAKKRQEQNPLSTIVGKPLGEDIRTCVNFATNFDGHESERKKIEPQEPRQRELIAADAPRAIQPNNFLPLRKARLDLNNPNLDDPNELAAIEKMKVQIQALYPEDRKVHPKHKKCPVCQKHFYHRPALLSHMKNKWKYVDWLIS